MLQWIEGVSVVTALTPSLFLGRRKRFSLHQNCPTGSGIHPAFYSAGRNVRLTYHFNPIPKLRLSRAIPLLSRLLSWLLLIELRNMRLFCYAVRTGSVQRYNPGRILAHRTVRMITTRSDGEYGLYSVMQLASVNFKRKARFCQYADGHSVSLHMTDG